MRIAFVCPWVPSKVRPRAYGLIDRLVRDHEVWLVCHAAQGEPTAHLEGMGLAGYTVVPRRNVRGVARASTRWFLGRSLQVELLADPAVTKAVADVEGRWRPDLFHFNVIRSAGGLAGVRHTPVVFDMDEVRSDYYAQVATTSSSPVWRVVAKLELDRLRSAEVRVADRSDVVVYSSPTDVGRLSPASVLVRSPHELAAFGTTETTPSDASSKQVLFVGRLGYRANREAIEWFITKVWPQVRRAEPSAQLIIVGENPGEWGNATNGIVVTGWVESVAQSYEQAALAIVPVHIGTGVQMKLIQAMYAGIPVVTNKTCAWRAGAPDNAVEIAETASDWVRSITRLLGDADERRRLGRAAAEWARDVYSDKNIYDELLLAYEQALRADPQS